MLKANFSAILNITSQLTDSERYSTIAAIRVLDPYSEKDFPRKNVAAKDIYRHKPLVSEALNYALITMVREESDISKVIMDRKGYQGRPYKENPYGLFRSRYIQPVIDYYEQFPPDTYIKKILEDRYTKEYNGLSFGFQWYFYKKRLDIF